MKMMNLNLSKPTKTMEIAAAILLAALFVLPFLSFAKQGRDIYVDVNAKGEEKGTAASPYRSISAALRNASKEDDVHIANGTYRENIEIPKEVSVFGQSKNNVIIEASNDDKDAVVMKDDSRINKVTIRKGKNGIKVKEDAEVSIIECVIEKNDHDGISIEEGEIDKDKMVSISDSTIRKNERAGIFSEKRKLSLIDNDIVENDDDGIDFKAGVSVWMKGNDIKDNGGVGMRAVLDGSSIWTNKNSFENNDDGGILIDAFGGKGRIDIKNSKFTDNGGFAITRLSHGAIAKNVWNGFTFNNNNIFKNNSKGNVK